MRRRSDGRGEVQVLPGASSSLVLDPAGNRQALQVTVGLRGEEVFAGLLEDQPLEQFAGLSKLAAFVALGAYHGLDVFEFRADRRADQLGRNLAAVAQFGRVVPP